MSATLPRSRIRASSPNSNMHMGLPHTSTSTRRLFTTLEGRLAAYMTLRSSTPGAITRITRPCRSTIHTISTRC